MGDTLVYINALGDKINLRLVAGLAASVFQGSIIVDNKYFLDNFPSSNGSNVLLIDGDIADQNTIADELDLMYRKSCISINNSAQRLAEFMTVTIMYLSIFLVLDALSLLIGFITAVISVYPVIQSAIENVSMGFVESLMTIIFVNGVVWILILAAFQLRKMKLVEVLRSE